MVDPRFNANPSHGYRAKPKSKPNPAQDEPRVPADKKPKPKPDYLPVSN